MSLDETPTVRENRQRLSAMMTLEAITEAGIHFRPMIEVIGEAGPVVLIGWPGGAPTPTARALELGVALAMAAYFDPVEVCVVYDGCFKSIPADQLPEGQIRLDEDAEARDCLVLIRSTEARDTLELLPYGRGDDGRLCWAEPSGLGGLAPAEPAARMLRDFWGEESTVIRLPEVDLEARLVVARMFVPGLTVLPLE